MSLGTLWHRLVRGVRWDWSDERYRAALPPDVGAAALTIASSDRFHAKQGRSSARVRFRTDGGEVSVYLKRHDRLPWAMRLAALVDPSGRHSPAATEWAHLERARSLGVRVPEVVAVGERIGPWGALRSFLMVAELAGCRELNEVLPDLAAAMVPREFAVLKRRVVVEMAKIVARLHGARVFHKDLYLCHFLIDVPSARAGRPILHLIDLHRLAEHRRTAPRWRWKDLGQLLYSTYGVGAIDDRDRLRFWRRYRRLVKPLWPGWQARMIRAKAARYLAHNR
jgi:heptose I phosphotransferase